MYSRLKLSRNLLQDDGVIFVSIDDNEVANLLKLMNEVFGEDNFVANIIWRKKYGVQNDAKHFSTSHEYIVCYAKDKSIFRPKLLERSEEQNNRYKNPDNDARGPWKPENLTVGRVTAKDIYPITTPSGRVVSPPEGRSWVVSEEKYRVLLADNRIWFGESGGNVPAVKRFLSEVKQGITPATFWDYDEVGHTDGSNKALKALFGNKQYFDYPKPVDLIKRIIKISTTDGIILDFFSGSGTTGHAVMEMNAEDGGDRRFILVQLPEDCPPKSEALKSGFKTIADITKERLKLSGIKVKSELGSLVNSELDIGFRVLKVDTSNFNETYQNPDAIDQDLLSSHVDNILRDRSGEDLLFQVLLSWGVDLSLPIEKKNINGKDLYIVDGNALVACFDQNGGVDEDLIRSISEICPLRVVFRDAGFKNDAMKINVEQIFKTLSPNTEIKTI
jgi:adenine-specific DNA-methyltransferase